MKKVVFSIGFLVLALAFSKSANAQVLVGSWKVDDGPSWTLNPPVWSGIQTASHLFGGDDDDWAISTSPLFIDHMAHEDFWGGSDVVVAEDYSKGANYNTPGGYGSAYSAYVSDHGDSNINYAYRIYVDRHDQPNPDNGNNTDEGLGDDIPVGGGLPCDPPANVPEPLSLCTLAIGGAGLALRKRSI